MCRYFPDGAEFFQIEDLYIYIYIYIAKMEGRKDI